MFPIVSMRVVVFSPKGEYNIKADDWPVPWEKDPLWINNKEMISDKKNVNFIFIILNGLLV